MLVLSGWFINISGGFEVKLGVVTFIIPVISAIGMRLWLLMALLLVPFSVGLVVDSTGISGLNPLLYGELVAYESAGEVHVYDLIRREDFSFGSGKNPFLFGFTLVFEAKESVDVNGDGDEDDSIVKFVNVRDRNVLSTDAVGNNPSVFADTIFFSSKESDLGIDFTNDGDLSDVVLRYYDVKSGTVVNSKVVGDFPVANHDYVVLETSESQVDVDLNADGDKSDSILRVYHRESRQASNIPVSGSDVVLSKEGFGVFVSDGFVKILDARNNKVIDTGLEGSSPSISGDIVMFVHNGFLHGFDFDSKSLAKLDVVAEQVSVFEDLAVFSSSEKNIGDLNGDNDQDDVLLRFARAEDIDGDDVFDFVDNCASVINEEQVDSDNDGVGDACESVSKNKEVVSETVSNDSNVTSLPVESSGFSWYWLILLILVLPFAVKFGIRYYKRRKKSFGF